MKGKAIENLASGMPAVFQIGCIDFVAADFRRLEPHAAHDSEFLKSRVEIHRTRAI
jgi:hypothetical protein